MSYAPISSGILIINIKNEEKEGTVTNLYLSSREGGWDGGEWKSYFTKIIFNIFPSSLFLFPSIVARTSRWVSVLSIKILKILGGAKTS